jgi:exosortase A-associated hydrolase 1
MSDGMVEEVVEIHCRQSRMWGILSRPSAQVPPAPIAVLIVVGGPQYRVGSHRQFVLLARALAAAGFAALRFDYRGMGDSEGEKLTFEAIEPDIDAAIEALLTACPGAQRVAIWGLCDAASAALMHATLDARVTALVIANPWARSPASLAAVRVRHYYLRRIVQRDFWVKLLSGGLRWSESLQAFFGAVGERRRAGRGAADGSPDESFRGAMARGLARFRGPVLLILSGDDLTAREFLECVASSREWRGLLARPNVRRFELPESDHTFSRRDWQVPVEAETVSFLRRLSAIDRARGVERRTRA